MNRFPSSAPILLAALLLIPTGCTRGPEEMEFVAPEMLRLGKSSPRVFVKAWPLDGELTRPGPVVLDGPCTLSFIPFAAGSGGEDLAFEAYLLVDGGETSRIFSGTPCFIHSGDFEDEEGQTVLERSVEVDLSPYRGKRVSFKWILRGRNGPARGAVGCPKIFPVPEPGAPRPDILFVCSDAHRYDHAFGEAGRRLMPCLNRLGESSVVYHRAYSTASWTMPSIATVLTGLDPRYHLTGFPMATVDRTEGERLKEGGLPPGRFLFPDGNRAHLLSVFPDGLETLTAQLAAQGYATAMVSANPLYRLSGLFAEGQDLFVRIGVKPGERLNEAAFRIMERRPAGQPLFLLVHYMDVHRWLPWYFQKNHPDLNPRVHRKEAAQSYAEAVGDADDHLRALLERWDRSAGDRTGGDGAVGDGAVGDGAVGDGTAGDSAVGDGTRGRQDSLVVFFADHGEHIRDPGRDLLGHGNSMDEVLLRVPLLVRYPPFAGVKPGGVEAPVSLADLPATVLALLGLEGGGRSLLRIAPAGEALPRRFFADSQLYGDRLSSVREGPFKLVLNFDGKTRILVDTTLPFTEQGEPGQVVEDDARAAKLAQVFEAYLRSAAKAAEGLTSERIIELDEALEELESLGYVK